MDGYTVNANNVCVKLCELPCVECVDNWPTWCTACQLGSYISGTTCKLNTTCNNDSSCVYCGQGLGYFLVPVSTTGGYCSECPQIANCLQCSENNAYYCAVCRNGYYRENNGTCSQCHSNCTSCISNYTCTACSDGWTLSQAVSRGRCLECAQRCQTCYGMPNYCTSCKPGFVKKGWRCRNSTYIYFRFVITISITVAMGDYDNIIIGIYLLLMPWKSSLSSSLYDTSIIDIDEFSSGSTVVSGAAAPSSADVSLAAASSSLSSGLSSGSIPGTSYSVSSSQVSIQSQDASEDQEAGMSMGIIAGAAAGGVVIIVVIIVIICVKRRKAQVSQIAPQDSMDDMVVKMQGSHMKVTQIENVTPEVSPQKRNHDIEVVDIENVSQHMDQKMG